MARAKQQSANEVERKLLQLDMNLVLEPEAPIRESMDGERMEELRESLSAIGLLNPILVAERGGVYEIVAGHRRYLAARDLGWKFIPAFIHDDAAGAREAAMLHENVVREDLNPAEEAIFFAELLDKHKLDEEGLCKMVKRGPNYIADRLRLLRNDPMVFQALRAGQITFATARELNKFPDEAMRRYYLDAAVRSGCASRVVTQWLNDWRANQVTVDTSNQPAAVQVEAPQVEAQPFACEFCGGHKDPWNLVTVQIHRWELDQIKESIRRGMNEALDGGGK